MVATINIMTVAKLTFKYYKNLENNAYLCSQFVDQVHPKFRFDNNIEYVKIGVSCFFSLGLVLNIISKLINEIGSTHVCCITC